MTVSFVHGTNVAAIDVVYAHTEHPTYTLTLSGNPEPGEGSPATVSGVVDIAHIQGVYRMERVLLYTFAGSVVHTDAIFPERWPDIVIHEEDPTTIRDVEVNF